MMAMSWKVDRPCWLKASLAALFGLPVALLTLPADFFDHGPPTCPSATLIDQECYGRCLTRACMHALPGDLATAWAFNPVVAIVLSLLVLGLLMEVWVTWRWLKAAQVRSERATENAS